MEWSHKEIRALLRSTRQPHRLERSPVGRALRATFAASSARDALLAVVRRALVHHDTRFGEIIERCDLRGEHAKVVADELHLSPRQFFRYRARAFEAIAAEIEGAVVFRERCVGPVDERRFEAAQLYGRGRFYWLQRTAAGYRAAQQLFLRALERDPGYSRAYVGLADNYLLQGEFLGMSPATAFPEAERLARRAIELDPALADAHATLADLYAFGKGNWRAARAAVRRALSIDPNCAVAHDYGAWLAHISGHVEEGTAHAQRLIELNPVATKYHLTAAMSYAFRRQTERAIELFRDVLAMDPSNSLARLTLAMALAYDRRHAEAAAELAQVTHEHLPQALGYLGFVEASAGGRPAAERRLAQVVAAAERRYVSHFPAAMIYAGLGDHGETLRLLERAETQHEAWLAFVGLEPAFDFLRGHPRFERFRERVIPSPN